MKIVIPSLVSLVLGGALVLGCSGEKASDDASEKSGGDAAEMEMEMEMEMEKEEGAAAEEELPEGLQGLDPETLALVQAQETCPVSGEPLGSMGAPIRKEVDGKVVFLCCKSCNKKFDADPQKYIAIAEGG